MTLLFNSLKKNLKKDISLFPKIKVSLLGDTATQLLVIALKGMAIERGYSIDMYEAEYNQVERQVLESSSEFYEFGSDFSIVFQSTHKLLELYGKRKLEDKINIADERIAFVEMMCEKVHGKLIYYNYPEIDDAVFGNYANKIEESFIYQIRKLNFELMKLARKYPDLYICDISSIQNKIGRDAMFNAKIYTGSEMVLSIDSLPLIASRTIDLIRVIKGDVKKCLILDLDNTIWGGIIGDDGIENIQIGHGLGIGKVFTEFQVWIKKLKERGIIIAVCSKNTESVAKEPFEKHPEMVLRLDDISVFMANWENKADNIRKIQSILNIGFDSMVFLDDNPFERNIVMENIPEVCVPDLPPDPADYLEYLYGLNLFETASYSSTDKDRTKQYQVEAQRISTQNKYTNLDDYLKSLNMVSEINEFTKFNIPRVAQLTQRSNQFNLRTIRYSENEITQLSKNQNYQCFSYTLEDRFGDNGLICVIILEKKDIETLFINTWLMSCRVLKRGMENFTLNNIVKYAKDNGYRYLKGEYIATSKNEIIKEHYSNLGFIKQEGDERNLFILNIDSYRETACYIEVK